MPANSALGWKGNDRLPMCVGEFADETLPTWAMRARKCSVRIVVHRRAPKLQTPGLAMAILPEGAFMSRPYRARSGISAYFTESDNPRTLIAAKMGVYPLPSTPLGSAPAFKMASINTRWARSLSFCCADNLKRNFGNFDPTKKNWFSSEILTKKHYFDMNFSIWASTFWKSGSENLCLQPPGYAG